MKVTTVGELIDVLIKYDRATPVLKTDPGGPGYFDIIPIEKMLYQVVAAGYHHGFPYYLDAPDTSLTGFRAVAI